MAGNLTHCQRRGQSLLGQNFFLEHPPSPLGACSESGPGPRVPCVVWQNLAQHCRSVRVPAAQVHLQCRVLLVLFNTSSHLLLERTVDPSQRARACGRTTNAVAAPVRVAPAQLSPQSPVDAAEKQCILPVSGTTADRVCQCGRPGVPQTMALRRLLRASPCGARAAFRVRQTLGATEQTAQRRPKATQRRSDRKPCLEAESKFDLPELVSRASLRAPIDASLRKAQGTSGCSIVEEAAAAPWLFQWLGYSEYSHRPTSVRCSSMALPMRPHSTAGCVSCGLQANADVRSMLIWL